MTRSLHRACLGCKRPVRGKPRCADCQRQRDQAKRARRPDLYSDAAERRRRARVVADHRAIVGDWCPGWAKQPAHQSADLTADHVREVARGGRPDGHLVVRCRTCNAARSAHLAHLALGFLTRPKPHDPQQGDAPITHGDGQAGPAVA
jgi:hypothetical protein